MAAVSIQDVAKDIDPKYATLPACYLEADEPSLGEKRPEIFKPHGIAALRSQLIDSIVTSGGCITASPVRRILEGVELGYHTVENSIATTIQFVTILAFTGHPLIRRCAEISQLWKDQERVSEEFGAIFKAQVLSGFNILDVGSGIFAATAKLSRALGAECWTVDRREMPNNMPESKWHIVLDLHDQDIVSKIKSISRTEFDIVTEANLEADGGHLSSQAIAGLLKVGGVFISGSPWWDGEVGNVIYIKQTDGKLKRIDA